MRVLMGEERLPGVGVSVTSIIIRDTITITMHTHISEYSPFRKSRQALI